MLNKLTLGWHFSTWTHLYIVAYACVDSSHEAAGKKCYLFQTLGMKRLSPLSILTALFFALACMPVPLFAAQPNRCAAIFERHAEPLVVAEGIANEIWTLFLRYRGNDKSVEPVLLRKIMTVLDNNGVGYSVAANGDIIIGSEATDSFVNNLANNLRDKFSDLRLKLNLARLLEFGAGYRTSENIIWLPIELFVAPRIGLRMVAHELKHADFAANRAKNRSGAYDGWIFDEKLGPEFLEEIFTYSMEIRTYVTLLSSKSQSTRLSALEHEIGLLRVKTLLNRLNHIATNIVTSFEGAMSSIQKPRTEDWEATTWEETVDGQHTTLSGWKHLPTGLILTSHLAPNPQFTDVKGTGSVPWVHLGFYFRSGSFFRSWIVSPDKADAAKSRLAQGLEAALSVYLATLQPIGALARRISQKSDTAESMLDNDIDGALDEISTLITISREFEYETGRL